MSDRLVGGGYETVEEAFDAAVLELLTEGGTGVVVHEDGCAIGSLTDADHLDAPLLACDCTPKRYVLERP